MSNKASFNVYSKYILCKKKSFEKQPWKKSRHLEKFRKKMMLFKKVSFLNGFFHYASTV